MNKLARYIWHAIALYLALAFVLADASAQSAVSTAVGRTSAASSNGANSTVPPLVRFSGVAKDADNTALTGTVGVTFMIYREQRGGSPLWLETQNVQPDSSGQYSVLLGATKADGLPAYLFASGEARWLAVQFSGQAEQPRVLLLSVPYAMKAADADTVGGLPASAFLLASQLMGATGTASSNANSSSSSQAALSGVTEDVAPTGSGTTGFLPLWTTASNLGNSTVFQSSTGAIGINTMTPAVNLDVNGNMYIRGGFTMFPEGTATASTGFSSHSYFFTASAYNSSSAMAENQSFAWQASALNNDTATPSAALKLRFAEGTGASEPTGFQIASNGILTFATGQLFPGTLADTGSQSVNGSVTATTATGNGLVGSSSSTGGVGVQGTATASSGFTSGVSGTTSSPTGYGVSGSSTSTASGALGGVGVFGYSGNPSGYGVEGTSGNIGVYGTGGGVGSKSGTGVMGLGNAVGVYGGTSGTFLSTGQIGVYGTSSAPSSYGVYGSGTGTTSYGVYGTGTTGVYGTGTTGVYGSGATGLFGIGTVAVEGVASGSGSYAGYFNGLVGITGNTNSTYIGDPGCGSGYAGLGFVPSGVLSGCTNYAIIGGPAGGTFINSSGTASIHFRSNNNELATIDNDGNVNIIGQAGGGNLSVAGKETSGNVFAQASASNSASSQVHPGSCTQGTLTASDANCLVPNMTLTATTSNPTALILVDIGGVTTDPCATANFYLLVDGKIVALSTISLNTNNSAFGYETGTVTITKLQSLAAGSHTFEVQSTTDYAGASCDAFTSATGISQGDGGMGSFRSLTVREF